MDMSEDGNVLVCKYGNVSSGTKAKTYFSASGGSGWSSGNIDDGDTSRSFDGTFFSAVDLNDDGSTLAISSTIHSGGVNYQTGPGAVWIYSRNGNNWTQKNNTNDPTGGSYNNAGVSGVANGDYFGHSVSLSSDGNRIAVGAPFADGDGLANNGSISIWDWTEITGAGDDRTEWVQVGSTKYGHINGSGDGLGHSIALSKDGNVIISGAPNREYARVFRWDGSDWNAEATFNVDINSSDCFGDDVDIDADGNTVVVSANGCDGENDRGYVNVYRRSKEAPNWILEWSQLGESILGEYDDDGRGFQADEFGYDVSISDNGNIVSISSRKNPGSLDTSSQYQSAGHVRVYEYSNGAWVQLDNDLDGTVKDARFGENISLSGDGKKITILSGEDNKIHTYTRSSDANTNPPVFTTASEFTVDENQTDIGYVWATDIDGDPLTYSMIQCNADPCTIDFTNGTMTFRSSPDYETKNSYNITIKAEDGVNETHQDIIININNLNDNAPVFDVADSSSTNQYWWWMYEEQNQISCDNAFNQSACKEISATDPDGDTISFSLDNISGVSSNEININSSTGAITLINADWDSGVRDVYADVIASDGTYSESARIRIELKDADDITYYLYAADGPFLGCIAGNDCETSHTDSLCNESGNYGDPSSTSSIWYPYSGYGATNNVYSPWYRGSDETKPKVYKKENNELVYIDLFMNVGFTRAMWTGFYITNSVNGSHSKGREYACGGTYWD